MTATKSLTAVICAALLSIAGVEGAKAQTAQELAAQYQSAMQACKNRFPTVTPKNVVAKMECTNRAQAIVLPNFGSNGDLVQAFMAYRSVVAERIQNKKMTMAEGFAAVSQRLSEMQTEMRRRNAYAAQADAARAAAQQNAVAQQNAADRANAAADAQMWVNIFQALKPAPAPVPSTQNVRVQSTCINNGNMTFCH